MSGLYGRPEIQAKLPAGHPLKAFARGPAAAQQEMTPPTVSHGDVQTAAPEDYGTPQARKKRRLGMSTMLSDANMETLG